MVDSTIAMPFAVYLISLLPVSFLHFSHQFVCGELPSDHHDQILNHILRTVHIQQPSNDYWQTAWVHLEYMMIRLQRTQRNYHSNSFSGSGVKQSRVYKLKSFHQ